MSGVTVSDSSARVAGAIGLGALALAPLFFGASLTDSSSSYRDLGFLLVGLAVLVFVLAGLLAQGTSPKLIVALVLPVGCLAFAILFFVFAATFLGVAGTG